MIRSIIVCLVLCAVTQVRSGPAAETDCRLSLLSCVDVTGRLRCLKTSDICDGEVHCRQGEDEKSCVLINKVNLQACARICKEEAQFNCAAFHYNMAADKCLVLTPSTGELSHFVQQGADNLKIYRKVQILSENSELQGNRTKRQVRFPSRDTFGGIAGRSSSSRCASRSVNFQPPRGRQARVINGVTPPPGAYPWLVLIKKLDGATMTFQQHCGGSIISENHVLTAAHCLIGLRPRDLKIVVGEYDVKTPESLEEVFEVEKFAMHQDYYSNHKRSNDIAIMKIRSKNGAGIRFSPSVQQICLPSSDSVYQPGLWCEVAGWGAQIPGNRGSVSHLPRAISVPIISPDTCSQKDVYGEYPTNQGLTDGMICAGFLEGGTDACSGDSGGPLACQIDGSFQLLGIVSWGEGCAKKNKPGVYTKVSYYSQWIAETMGKL